MIHAPDFSNATSQSFDPQAAQQYADDRGSKYMTGIERSLERAHNAVTSKGKADFSRSAEFYTLKLLREFTNPDQPIAYTPSQIEGGHEGVIEFARNIANRIREKILPETTDPRFGEPKLVEDSAKVIEEELKYVESDGQEDIRCNKHGDVLVGRINQYPTHYHSRQVRPILTDNPHAVPRTASSGPADTAEPMPAE